MTITPENQTIVLLPEGAVLLPEHGRVLVVADLHLGKSAAFRAAGIPVPEGDSARDLQRLSLLCEKHQAQRLVIAGDLVHSLAGRTHDIERMFESFISNIRIPLLLVRGNHDRQAGEPWRLCPVAERLEFAGLHIVHDPADAREVPLHLAAHLHPAVRIPDTRGSLRLPCFLLRGNVLVLPAFGGFTGKATVRSEPGDRFFVPLGSQVVELPRQLVA